MHGRSHWHKWCLHFVKKMDGLGIVGGMWPGRIVDGAQYLCIYALKIIYRIIIYFLDSNLGMDCIFFLFCSMRRRYARNPQYNYYFSLYIIIHYLFGGNAFLLLFVN